MMAVVLAGLLYGLAIFALGFVLGTLRELVLAPILGRDAVVLVETPIILIAAWLTSGWLIRRWSLAPKVTPRMAMGAAAFALLMVGEALVAVFGFGRGLAVHLAGYATLRGLLELAPQALFALFPTLRLLAPRAS
jgi:hypothetical protein